MVQDAVAQFLDGVDGGIEVAEAVEAWVAELGGYDVRVTRSQVAFRRRRGFCWLWRPDRWLAHPRSPLVLSFALPTPVDSPRLAEVVHPSPGVWMHHLDVHAAGDLDDEVAGWVRAAYAAAG